MPDDRKPKILTYQTPPKPAPPIPPPDKPDPRFPNLRLVAIPLAIAAVVIGILLLKDAYADFSRPRVDWESLVCSGLSGLGLIAAAIFIVYGLLNSESNCTD